MDPTKHMELLEKILDGRYCCNGDPNAHYTLNHLDLVRAQNFIKYGGQMQIWRTRLLSNFGDSADRPAPPGLQTVILLTDKSQKNDFHPQCPGKTTKDWWRRTFVVYNDLSGPDQRLARGTAYVLTQVVPYIYKGETVFVEVLGGIQGESLTDGEVAVFKNFDPTGLTGGVCGFRYSNGN